MPISPVGNGWNSALDRVRAAGSAIPGQQSPGAARPLEGGPSFKDSLTNALRQVNELQLQAEDLSQALAAGQAADLHQVMLAAEKANLALQFTLQIRNKVIEAYQEIMRIQV